MSAADMATATSVSSDSQARFIGGLLLGAALFAVGCSFLLFSLSTPYFVATTERLTATAASVALLLVGGGTVYVTLR
jgi:hypothetical protein